MAYTQIGLADRTLMPGDVVRRRLPGENVLAGQAGYVRDVNVRADVMVMGSRMVIKNVPAERLRPISEWNQYVPLCMDTWIGTIIDINECAVLKYVSYLSINSGEHYFQYFFADHPTVPVWKSPPTISTSLRMLCPNAIARSSIRMSSFQETL